MANEDEPLDYSSTVGEALAVALGLPHDEKTIKILNKRGSSAVTYKREQSATLKEVEIKIGPAVSLKIGKIDDEYYIRLEDTAGLNFEGEIETDDETGANAMMYFLTEAEMTKLYAGVARISVDDDSH